MNCSGYLTYSFWIMFCHLSCLFPGDCVWKCYFKHGSLVASKMWYGFWCLRWLTFGKADALPVSCAGVSTGNLPNSITEDEPNIIDDNTSITELAMEPSIVVGQIDDVDPSVLSKVRMTHRTTKDPPGIVQPSEVSQALMSTTVDPTTMVEVLVHNRSKLRRPVHSNPNESVDCNDKSQVGQWEF